MCIILVMQVALLGTVICRINCFAITAAMVGAAPMGKVRPKDQQMSYEKPSLLRPEAEVLVSRIRLFSSCGRLLTWFQGYRCPFLLRRPLWLNAIIFSNRHIHFMTASHDF